MARPTKLTLALIEKVARMIRRGSFAHVAAQAVGISRQTFYRWMNEAEEGCGGLRAQFCDKVRHALAEARHNAEKRVFSERPYEWLRYGPGKDRGPDDPGWTERSTVEVDGRFHHAGLVQIEPPINHKTLAQAMVEMESLGLMPMFRALAGGTDGGDVLDGESTTTLLIEETSGGESKNQSIPGGSNGNGRAGH